VRRTTCFIAAKFRAFRRALRCFRPEPIPSNVLLSLAPVSLSVKRAPANIGQQGAADHKACYRKSRQQAGPKADPAEGEEQGAPSWPMRVIPALSGNSARTATATRNPATQTMEILNPRWKRLIHDRFAPAMGAVWRGEHGLLRGLLNFTEGEHNGTIFEEHADVAQLVEQLIRNQQVVSSSLTVCSIPTPQASLKTYRPHPKPAPSTAFFGAPAATVATWLERLHQIAQLFKQPVAQRMQFREPGERGLPVGCLAGGEDRGPRSMQFLVQGVHRLESGSFAASCRCFRIKP
jgi:hypothetical protein